MQNKRGFQRSLLHNSIVLARWVHTRFSTPNEPIRHCNVFQMFCSLPVATCPCGRHRHLIRQAAICPRVHISSSIFAGIWYVFLFAIPGHAGRCDSTGRRHNGWSGRLCSDFTDVRSRSETWPTIESSHKGLWDQGQ